MDWSHVKNKLNGVLRNISKMGINYKLFEYNLDPSNSILIFIIKLKEPIHQTIEATQHFATILNQEFPNHGKKFDMMPYGLLTQLKERVRASRNMKSTIEDTISDHYINYHTNTSGWLNMTRVIAYKTH